ncbi:SDR family oxidoreductase, partial [Mesorhizobium sp. M4A.F.Ca.ET.020.02.1.1]
MPKSWLITGTSSGFGRELTDLLLARGDTVAATLRKPGALDDLKAIHGDRLWVGYADVTDTAALRKVVDDAFTALGHVDFAVSNAGYGLFGGAEEVSDDQIRRQIDTNVIGSVQFARAVLPHFRNQESGHFFQIASALGQSAIPFASLYGLSKWAVEGFFEALAQEVASLGIKVTIVEPGGAKTDFGTRSGDLAPALDAYANTPVGYIRTHMASMADAAKGDPRKMAQAIIDVSERPESPLRLALGSDAYEQITTALRQRFE